MSVWPRGGVFGADSRRQNVRSRRSRLRFARGHLCQVATEAVFARLRRSAPGAPSVWFPFAGQKSPELGGQGWKFCTPGPSEAVMGFHHDVL